MPVLWPWLRALAGLGILVALLARLGSETVLDGLRAIDVGAVLAALGIGLATTVLSAWRWCLVARGLGLPLGLWEAVAQCCRRACSATWTGPSPTAAGPGTSGGASARSPSNGVPGWWSRWSSGWRRCSSGPSCSRPRSASWSPALRPPSRWSSSSRSSPSSGAGRAAGPTRPGCAPRCGRASPTPARACSPPAPGRGWSCCRPPRWPGTSRSSSSPRGPRAAVPRSASCSRCWCWPCWRWPSRSASAAGDPGRPSPRAPSRRAGSVRRRG